MKIKLLLASLLIIGACSSPDYVRTPANGKSDLGQYYVLEGSLSFWADNELSPKQRILSNNHELIKVVYLKKDPLYTCAFTQQGPYSTVSEEDGYLYFNVGPGDSVECDFQGVLKDKTYQVFYALDVMDVVSPDDFFKKVDGVKKKISNSIYDEQLFQDLKELGIYHMFEKVEVIGVDNDELFRRIIGAKKGDYLSLEASAYAEAGVLCDDDSACKVTSNFRGINPDSSVWKKRFTRKLALKEFFPLELVCGEKVRGAAHFDKLLFRGSANDVLEGVVDQEIYCAINHPTRGRKSLQTVYGNYKFKGIHIGKESAFKILEDLKKERITNLTNNVSILNFRRYTVALNELQGVVVDVRGYLHQAKLLKLARLNNELKDEIAKINKLREAELEKIGGEFEAKLNAFRSQVSQYVPWESHQVLGDREYRVTVVPRISRYNSRVIYDLTNEMILKKSKDNFFMESTYVEYVLLGKSEFLTKEVSNGQLESPVSYKVCAEDFHRLKIDLADEMEIASGDQIHKVFKKYDGKDCAVSMQRAVNVQLNLVDDFMGTFQTSYCSTLSQEDRGHVRFTPSSLRVYYGDGTYKELKSGHPFFKVKAKIIAGNFESFLEGQTEYCTDIYEGVFPIYSSIDLVENPSSLYSYPLSVVIGVNEKDEWPDLTAAMKAINEKYDADVKRMQMKYDGLKLEVIRKFQALYGLTWVKGNN